MTRGRLVLGGLVAAAVLALAAWYLPDLLELRAEIRAARRAWIDSLASLAPAGQLRDFLSEFFRLVLFSPSFYVAMAGILALERLFPADRKQRLFSPALANDFVWYLLEIGFFFAVQAAFVGFLRGIYDTWLSSLTIHSVLEWPAAARIVLAILLSDFLGYFHHWLRHKVRWLWFFHAVHHSQPQMNAWTDSRYHLMDYIEAQAIRFIPIFMLGVSQPAIVGYVFVYLWYVRFYHGNIRTNLGWLRYVFVTPQSHRVHHSIEPEHQDQNLGVLFSIWDHLFGTQCRDYDVYPRTGIQDSAFPLESDWRSVLSLKPIWKQQWYPIKQVWRSVARSSGERESVAGG